MEVARKRKGYLSKESFYMGMALLSAKRSKDPRTQVGAAIIDPEGKVVSIGYNGFPRGCSDDNLPWQHRAECSLDTKYPYVCHAEMNAIMNKGSSSIAGTTIYVTLFPCNQCAKLIIQSRVKSVVYLSDKNHDKPSAIAARRMFNAAGVSYRPMACDISQCVLLPEAR